MISKAFTTQAVNPTMFMANYLVDLHKQRTGVDALDLFNAQLAVNVGELEQRRNEALERQNAGCSSSSGSTTTKESKQSTSSLKRSRSSMEKEMNDCKLSDITSYLGRPNGLASLLDLSSSSEDEKEAANTKTEKVDNTEQGANEKLLPEPIDESTITAEQNYAGSVIPGSTNNVANDAEEPIDTSSQIPAQILKTEEKEASLDLSENSEDGLVVNEEATLNPPLLQPANEGSSLSKDELVINEEEHQRPPPLLEPAFKEPVDSVNDTTAEKLEMNKVINEKENDVVFQNVEATSNALKIKEEDKSFDLSNNMKSDVEQLLEELFLPLEPSTENSKTSETVISSARSEDSSEGVLVINEEEEIDPDEQMEISNKELTIKEKNSSVDTKNSMMIDEDDFVPNYEADDEDL